jgi:hypothetical protein
MSLDTKLPFRAERMDSITVELCRRFAILLVVSARLVCQDSSFAFTLWHLDPLAQPLTYPPKPHISPSRLPLPVIGVHHRGEVCILSTLMRNCACLEQITMDRVAEEAGLTCP